MQFRICLWKRNKFVGFKADREHVSWCFHIFYLFGCQESQGKLGESKSILCAQYLIFCLNPLSSSCRFMIRIHYDNFFSLFLNQLWSVNCKPRNSKELKIYGWLMQIHRMVGCGFGIMWLRNRRVESSI